MSSTMLWWIMFAISSLPLAISIYKVSRGNSINPFEEFMTVSGHAALIFLVLTLSVTPVRRWLTGLFTLMAIVKWGKRLSDWNVLIRYRRFLGLWCFAYAVLHALAYFYFELGLMFEELFFDIATRRHMPFGLAALIMLLLLALTSTKSVMKMMGVWWRRLHRLIYVLSVCAIVHYALATKITDTLPIVYGGLVAILLMHRVFVRVIAQYRRPDDSGMEHVRSK